MELKNDHFGNDAGNDDGPGDFRLSLAGMATSELEAMYGDDKETDEIIGEIQDQRWRKNKPLVLTVVIDGFYEEKAPSIRLTWPTKKVLDPRDPDLFACWEMIKKMLVNEPAATSWSIDAEGKRNHIYSIEVRVAEHSAAPESTDQPK